MLTLLVPQANQFLHNMIQVYEAVVIHRLENLPSLQLHIGKIKLCRFAVKSLEWFGGKTRILAEIDKNPVMRCIGLLFTKLIILQSYIQSYMLHTI